MGNAGLKQYTNRAKVNDINAIRITSHRNDKIE